jgi:hypothetical protein
MAGICDADVAAVPLVSVPVSPAALIAASAPPVFLLSAVVKYGLPRFFGMTKTFRPVFAVADPDPDPDELEDGAEPLDEQAATARADATTSVEAASGARLSKARMLGVFRGMDRAGSDGSRRVARLAAWRR